MSIFDMPTVCDTTVYEIFLAAWRGRDGEVCGARDTGGVGNYRTSQNDVSCEKGFLVDQALKSAPE